MVILKKVVIIVSSILVCLLIAGYFLFFYDKIEFSLNGKNNIELVVNNDYKDEGITLKNRNKIVPTNKYMLKMDNNLDNNILGNYLIKYTIKYKRKTYTLERHIKVIDNISPTLEVNTDNVTKDYCTKKIKTNLKYTANDNYDGDLSDKIDKEENEDTIILKVKDSSNNETTKEIKINYSDKPKNIFKLIGNNKVYVKLNGTYKESGTKYTDGCGNKIDKEIKINGEVDTSTLGEYKITYEVDNNKLTRKVIVYDPAKEEKSNGKTIYLTFDDGPGYYTNKILNILDKYNVKATFFVTNQFPSYANLIKTEYEKGHTVALHTYSHKYDIYTSIDTYLDDFNKMNEIIKRETGSYTRLFRFPGGSSNTVSKSYNKGIMTELSKRMTNDGYVYFDWNVSSGDASGLGSSKITSNVINGVKSCSKCVVLMHDIKSTTANALDDILNSLTNSGYTFAPLNENSPTAHHGINN